MTVGEQYSFYRVPKVLFTAECFKFLSCEAKGDCVGKPCGFTGADPVRRTCSTKEKRLSFIPGTLAEKVGISVNTVSRIEGGQAAISIEIFVKLVEVLGADANELLGKNPEGDRNPAHKMVSRVLNLQPKEQKIVIQTISALMDGIEGIR